MPVLPTPFIFKGAWPDYLSRHRTLAVVVVVVFYYTVGSGSRVWIRQWARLLLCRERAVPFLLSVTLSFKQHGNTAFCAEHSCWGSLFFFPATPWETVARVREGMTMDARRHRLSFLVEK